MQEVKIKLTVIFVFVIITGCYKPVYTEYFEKKNYTEFTTHPLLIEAPGDRKLELIASRRCPGKTLCQPKEIKLTLKIESKFAFLEGKNFLIETEGEKIDLNQRRYHFTYNAASKYRDGTTGFSIERWVVWLDTKEFRKVAHGSRTFFLIGEYSLEARNKELIKWRFLINHSLLLETMEEEDKRSYGKYTKAPAAEAEIREKFESKAFVEAEKSTWEMVKDSESPEDLKFFLEQYPSSLFAPPARLKLKQLERKATE